VFTLVLPDTQGLFCVQKNSQKIRLRNVLRVNREELIEMLEIIIYITLGVVFGFCAVMLCCLFPIDKLFSRKGKKGKRADVHDNDDTRTGSMK
jgi:hypothetical protein